MPRPPKAWKANSGPELERDSCWRGERQRPELGAYHPDRQRLSNGRRNRSIGRAYFLAVIFGVALNAVGRLGAPILDLILRATKVVFTILG